MSWASFWEVFLYFLSKWYTFMTSTVFFNLPFAIGYIFISAIIFRVLIFALVPAVSTSASREVNNATNKHIRAKQRANKK